ncbi:MAG: LamG-like jellyroll fold domain-containing protein [Verrucomicrobiales bacterium]
MGAYCLHRHGGRSLYLLRKNGLSAGGGAMAASFGSETNTNPLYIGSRADLFTTFNGLMDEVAVWNRALTEAEIAQVAAGPVFGGPIIGLTPREFSSTVTQGSLVATLTASDAGNPGDTYTYALVAGDGATDNGKFQVAGDQLQAGTHNFSLDPGGTTYSVRIQATGAPSGETGEAAFILTVRADSDADSLPDEYELLWATDLTILSGLGGADADDDGLTDLEEFNLAGQYPTLDPTDDDSDDDTLKDGAELAGAGSRPPTDPTNADTDGDTLGDGVETNAGVFVSAGDTGTNPTAVDSDGDGSDDAAEVVFGSDPNNPNDFPPVQLVGLWRFEGNADDSSGLGNDGTLMGTPGPAFATDVPAALADGQSLSFTTGVNHDEHVLVPHAPSLDITGEITITAWIKPENNQWDGILAKAPSAGSSANFPGNYELRTNNGGGSLEFGFELDPGPPDLIFLGPSSGSVPQNEWSHVAFTAEAGGEYHYYINGAEVGSGSMDAGFGSSTNTNPVYIGNRGDFTTIEFQGLMDDVALFNGVVGEAQIQKIMEGDFSDFGVGSGSRLQLDIEIVGGDLVIRWPSTLGNLYNLRSETDLSAGEPKDWPIFGGNMDIPATPPTNTLTIPLPADPTRFFVIEEFPAPPVPLFSDDFESGQGGWTVGSDGVAGTAWQLGTPSNVGPLTTNSGVNCFATNLASNYGDDANVWLRSPAIDLTGVGAATLNYAQFTDIEMNFDSGTVSVLNAADDSLIEEIEGGVDGFTSQWDPVRHRIPAAALGKVIKIEFRLQSDNFGPGAGWYIDDFLLTTP